MMKDIFIFNYRKLKHGKLQTKPMPEHIEHLEKSLYCYDIAKNHETNLCQQIIIVNKKLSDKHNSITCLSMALALSTDQNSCLTALRWKHYNKVVG